MKAPRSIGAVVIATALVAGLVLWRAPRHDAMPATASTPATGEARARAESGVPVMPRPPGDIVATTSVPLQVFALRDRLRRSSLRGTDRDGGVNVDVVGRVVADESLRQLFDYYLSLTGEFRADEIRALLLADLRDAHAPATADEAMAIFDRYVGMRAELASLTLPADPDARFAQVRAIRRDWFGEDAAMLFGGEDSHTEYTLARMAVLRVPELDPTERDARLRALDAQRTHQQRMDEAESTSALLAELQSRQFEHLRIDPQTRAAEREALWGEAASRRLAALDRARESWDERVSAYVHTRNAIADDPALDALSRQRALTDLLLRSFEGPERARIESLESIGALNPGG